MIFPNVKMWSESQAFFVVFQPPGVSASTLFTGFFQQVAIENEQSFLVAKALLNKWRFSLVFCMFTIGYPVPYDRRLTTVTLVGGRVRAWA